MLLGLSSFLQAVTSDIKTSSCPRSGSQVIAAQLLSRLWPIVGSRRDNEAEPSLGDEEKSIESTKATGLRFRERLEVL